MELKNTFFTAAATAAIVFGSPSLVKGQEWDSPKFKSETIVSTQKAEIGATLNETNAISDQYRGFIWQERKTKKMLETGKIKRDSAGIEIAGRKIPSNFTTFAEVKDNVPGLELGVNVFENWGFYYFTLGAAILVQNAGYPVFTVKDWEAIIDAFDGDFDAIDAAFNLPISAGVFGIDDEDNNKSRVMGIGKPLADGTPNNEYVKGLQNLNFDRSAVAEDNSTVTNGNHEIPCTDRFLLLVQRK